MLNKEIIEFYKDKKVFVTGCTGFKGSWLCEILLEAGAKVYGLGLRAEDESLWNILHLQYKLQDFYQQDITNYWSVYSALQKVQPDIIFHLAAQPIVLKSYDDPVNTYNTNVMGTVHLLDCARNIDTVKSIINITTDKVYLNDNSGKPFIESDKLCGYDPYSNSKSCSEMVTYSYYHSFFKERNVGIATVRAGNVIGGGDFGENRIIPDCFRSSKSGESIVIRNPGSFRPYQHVLDALFAYLMIGKDFYENPKFDSFNIGPDEAMSTAELTEIFCETWGDGQTWHGMGEHKQNVEAKMLFLNTSHLKETYNWTPLWDSVKAVQETAKWYKSYTTETPIQCLLVMKKQINEFIERT